MYETLLSLVSILSAWEKTSATLPADSGKYALSDKGSKEIPDSLSVNELARVTLDAIADAVISTDAAGKVCYMNSVAINLTGWTRQQAEGLPLAEVLRIFDAKTGKPMPDPALQAIAENRAVTLAPHCILIRHDDSKIEIEDSAAPILGAEGQIVGAVVIFRDAKFSSFAVNKTLELARHDPLTGLLNRFALNEQFESARSMAVRQNWKIGVLFIDVNRFKSVNDNLGHDAGDHVLVTIGQRIQGCLREVDKLCRYGGDEFVVLLIDIGESGGARSVVSKLKAAAAQPISFDGSDIQLSLSVGVSVFPDQGDDFAKLLHKADRAMLRSKRKSRRKRCV